MGQVATCGGYCPGSMGLTSGSVLLKRNRSRISKVSMKKARDHGRNIRRTVAGPSRARRTIRMTTAHSYFAIISFRQVAVVKEAVPQLLKKN